MDNTIQELYKRIAFLERENKELGKSLKMLQSASEYVKDGDICISNFDEVLEHYGIEAENIVEKHEELKRV